MNADSGLSMPSTLWMSKDLNGRGGVRPDHALGDKMVDALGGEQTLRRHTSKTLRGKREFGGMLEGTYESLRAAPFHSLQTTELPGMGRMEVGYNGTVGWQVGPHIGTKVLTGEDLTDMVVDSDFYAKLNYKKNHRSIKYVGLSKFDARDCHELRLTRENGKVQLQYIDAKTYLPIGSKGEVQSNVGPLVMTRTVDEFKAYDGEMIPIQFDDDVGGMQNQTTTITEVSFAPLAADTFDPPKKVVAALDD